MPLKFPSLFLAICSTSLVYAADLAKLSGPELVELLADPKTTAPAFAELFRRTEPAKERRQAHDYLHPEVIVCPQRNGPPIYIVLCEWRSEPSLDETAYQIPDIDGLFPPGTAGASVSTPPENWRDDKVVFAFSAEGEKQMPFGGWNMVHGYIFDLNGDGYIERIEIQSYSTERREDETIELVRVERVEKEAVPLLSVAINRGDQRDWGFAIQKEDDGKYAVLIGPKENSESSGKAGPGWRLKNMAAVFRWDEAHDRFVGPAGSAAEHFFLIPPDEDIWPAMAKIRTEPPFTAQPNGAVVLPTPVSTPAAKWQYVSLRGKSNEELLEIMTAGKDANQQERDAIVPTHLPARFWELSPKEAARALVEENRSPTNRAACRVALDDRNEATPPPRGEIGFEWQTSGCGFAPGTGRTTLDYTPGKSHCTLAQATLGRDVTPAVIARALAHPRTVSVPDDLARHAYETIWWLGRVRTICGNEPGISRITSTADGTMKFWLKPAQPEIDVTLFSGHLSERLGNYDREICANFALFVLRQLEILKIGLLDLEATPPTIGKPFKFTPEEDFVYNPKPPDPSQPAAVESYVTRLLAILQAPRQTVSIFHVISLLVPNEDPLRYQDPRIDDALFRMARAGLSTDGKGAGFPTIGYARWAACALAQRGQAEAFQLLLNLLANKENFSADRALDGLSLLSSQHPEFRDRMRTYLEGALRSIGDSRIDVPSLFDAIWIGHFSELTPLLAELSTASTEEIASRRSSGSGFPPDPAAARFHEARRILTAWQEEDALTRAKLCALLEAYTHRELPVPNLVRPLYEKLAATDQPAFCDFLAWFKEREAQRRPLYADRVDRITQIQNGIK